MLGASPNPTAAEPPANITSFFSVAALRWGQISPLGKGWEEGDRSVSRARPGAPPRRAAERLAVPGCALGRADLEASFANVGEGEKEKEEGRGRKKKKPHLT